MENNNEILVELQGISPLVAGLPRVNTYTVPPGYINNLSFDVATSVTIASYPKQIPYALPAGYFNGFADVILQKIKKENATLNNVPHGYFESLSSAIINKIKQQNTEVFNELEEISPELNKISKQNIYSVPAGYFESLEIIMPFNTVPAKVVRMRKRFIQYAVAACVTGILIVGAFIFINNDKTNSNQVISYKEAVKMDINKNVSSLTEDEINTYLSETLHTNYAIQTGNDINVEEDIDAVSDEEIKEFLEQQPIIYKES